MRTGGILIPALLATFCHWCPGQIYQNPVSLHLANYSTNHNHREFNGPQTLEAYLLAGVWALGTNTDLPERLQALKRHFRFSSGLRQLVPGERLNRHILENTAGLDAIFRSIARWTIAQKFWIISAGSHTVYFVPAAELF